jgi:hypothetical protein
MKSEHLLDVVDIRPTKAPMPGRFDHGLGVAS